MYLVLVFLAAVFALRALTEALGDRPAPAGITFFDAIPYLTISKKARGRGDVDHNGLTRRQRAHR